MVRQWDRKSQQSKTAGGQCLVDMEVEIRTNVHTSAQGTGPREIHTLSVHKY